MVCIKYTYSGRECMLMVASVCMPTEADISSFKMEQLPAVQYCKCQDLDLILGCDTNAHHFRWGSKECNPMVIALLTAWLLLS